MSESPRRPRPGWYPRPELIVAVVIIAAVVLVGGAVLRSRGTGSAASASVQVATSTAAAGGAPAAPSVALATSTPTPAPTETPTPTPTPTAPPAPVRPSVDLRPARVGNGDTMLVVVTAPAGDTGSITFMGQAFPLTRNGSELFTLIGVPIGADTGPGTLSVALQDADGTAAATLSADYTVFHVDRPIDNLTLTQSEASVLTADAGAKEAQLRTEQFSHFDRGRRWSEVFQWPVTGPITTYFGQGRRINGGPPGDFHSGTDIAVDEGTPVHAAAPGRVAFAAEMPIRGNTVVIDHGAGVMTSYSHLSEIDVTVNQSVDAGEVIGKAGHTGLATGPHLHWEVLIYGTDVDGIEWTKTDFTPPSSPPPTGTATATATAAASATPAEATTEPSTTGTPSPR